MFARKQFKTISSSNPDIIVSKEARYYVSFVGGPSFEIFFSPVWVFFDLKISKDHFEGLYTDFVKAYVFSSERFEPPRGIRFCVCAFDPEEFGLPGDPVYRHSVEIPCPVFKIIAQRALAQVKKVASSVTSAQGFGFSFSSYLDDYVGKGSFGTVWKRDGKALKVYYYNAKYSSEFVSEVSILKKCDHPNVVRVFETGLVFGRFAYTLELAEENLFTYIKRVRLPRSTLESVCRQISSAVAYIHSKNILHRDVSAPNILVFGQAENVKLCDFGTALILKKRITDEVIRTTKGYEDEFQLEGDSIGFEIDVYSMGCVFFDCMFPGLKFPRKTNDPRIPPDEDSRITYDDPIEKATWEMCLDYDDRRTAAQIALFLTGEHYDEPVLEEGSEDAEAVHRRNLPDKDWFVGNIEF